MILDLPEDKLRAAIMEMIEICGGDCRDLLPSD